MSEPSGTPENQPRPAPPPPSPQRLLWMRLVFALLGLGAFVGVWALTSASGLAAGWRIGIALLVAGPFLLIPDLLRDKSAPPPGFVPRKWEDEDD